MITLSARELNKDIQIISRADDEDSVKKITRAGASHVVSPVLKGADDIADLVIRPHVTEFLNGSQHSQSEYILRGLMINEGSSLVGQTVREYGMKENSLVFIAIKHAGGGTKIRPGAEEKFQSGDVVIIVGHPDAMVRMSDDAKGAGASSTA